MSLDSRLLNSVFDELVNFVEIELAHMNINLPEKKYKTHWRGRCPDAGIDYLKWALELKNDDNSHSTNKGQPSRQALAAQETLALYQWWKIERPNRPDSYSPSKHASHPEERHNLEKAQYDEDTAMLVRLVKNRQSLWT